ncbi:tRNA(Ile)-lysidine synthetase [Treponema sp. R8-4-B8]
MALLAALHSLRSGGVIGKDSLFCLHVEHGLRPAEESQGDAKFVGDFCKSNGIECRVENIPQGKIAALAQRRGIGIEAAARFFRHRALSKEANRLGDKTLILLAHTKNDLLETALMRILRGAGSAGLSAMPEKRGRLIRPLLKMTRANVVEYLKTKNISWREDSTNIDEKYLRNRIRRKLIPLLNEAFPSWESGIFGMAETQSLTAAFIAGEANTRVKWNNCKPRSLQNRGLEPEISHNASRDSAADKFSVFTEAKNFFDQEQIIREEAVFQAIDEFLKNKRNPRPVKRAVVRRFCAGAVNAADLGPVKIKREGEKIILSLARKEFFESGISSVL